MEDSNIYTSEAAKHKDLDLPLANAESMPIHTLIHSDRIAEKNAQRERESRKHVGMISLQRHSPGRDESRR